MKRKITPGRAGLLSAVFAFIFMLVFIILGFVQPGYNQFSNTISSLAVGQWGFVQTANFYLLAITFIALGYALGYALTEKHVNRILLVFTLFSLCAVTIAVFPTDEMVRHGIIRFDQLTTTARIHFIAVSGIIVFLPFLFVPILKKMKSKTEWRGMARLTLLMLIFLILAGSLWFGLIAFGKMNAWKGLFQKLMAVVALLWVMAIGSRCWILGRKTARG